jgi:hypothetical protein
MKKKKKAAGRPLKLTRELQDRLCQTIARGHYATTACAAVGIGESTFFRWLEWGEDHVEVRGGKRVEVTARPVYREFREAVEKAKATAQMLHMEALRDAAFETVTDPATGQTKVRSKNWTASAWFLERTAPHQFARREVVHQGEGAAPAKPDTARPKVVRFGGRYRDDGQLQTSALPPAEDEAA